MNITRLRREVLQGAVDDGGAIVFSGQDAQKWLTGKHHAAALWLAKNGFGRWQATSGRVRGMQFEITEAGRQCLAQQ